jgi:hypothetical protein
MEPNGGNISGPFRLESRVVGFADFLGSRELYKKAADDPELIPRILENLTRIKNASLALVAERESGPPDFCHSSVQAPLRLSDAPPPAVEMGFFSDSFVVSAGGENAETVVPRLQQLAFSLLEQGVLCRGGVVKGPLYHQDGIVFGPALNDAYAIESSVAVYPRIVLGEAFARTYLDWEDSVASRLSAGSGSELSGLRYPNLVKRDKDGCHFINLFALDPMLVPGGWDLGKARLPERYSRVREQLVAILRESSEGSNLSVLAKHRWICKEFNDAVAEHEFQQRVRRFEPILIP